MPNVKPNYHGGNDGPIEGSDNSFTLRVTGKLQIKRSKKTKPIDIFVNLNKTQGMRKVDQAVLNEMGIRHRDHNDYEIEYSIKNSIDDQTLPRHNSETVAAYFPLDHRHQLYGDTFHVIAMCRVRENEATHCVSILPRVAKSAATAYNANYAPTYEAWLRSNKRKQAVQAQKRKQTQASRPKKKVAVNGKKKEVQPEIQAEGDVVSEDEFEGDLSEMPLKDAIALVDVAYKAVVGGVIGNDKKKRGNASRLVKTLKDLNSKEQAYDFVVNRFASVHLSKGKDGKDCRKMWRELMKEHQRTLAAEHCFTSIQRGLYRFLPITYEQYWKEIGRQTSDKNREDDWTGLFVVEYSKNLEGTSDYRVDKYRFALIDLETARDFIKQVFEGCNDETRRLMFSASFFAKSCAPWFWSLVYHASYPHEEFVWGSNKKMDYMELMKKMVPGCDWDVIIPKSISKRSTNSY